MTDQGTRALLERMKSDAAFRDRVLGVADVEARLALVRAEGFDVTAAEIAAEAAQLSDEQLAQAVGAGSAACDVFLCSADDTCGG
jgi:predicted ribosomally synthesized peptide with nif11-like leader